MLPPLLGTCLGPVCFSRPIALGDSTDMLDMLCKISWHLNIWGKVFRLGFLFIGREKEQSFPCFFLKENKGKARTCGLRGVSVCDISDFQVEATGCPVNFGANFAFCTEVRFVSPCSIAVHFVHFCLFLRSGAVYHLLPDNT